MTVRAAAEKAVSTQSPEAKARIMLDIPQEFSVEADEERLPLVFSNLISNALKYSGESAPFASRRARNRANACCKMGGCDMRAPISRGAALGRRGVRDQGIGISPDDQKKLFQKFVRLSHSLTSSVRGTGWDCGFANPMSRRWAAISGSRARVGQARSSSSASGCRATGIMK